MKEPKKVLYLLIIGIWCTNILSGMVGGFIAKPWWSYVLGVLLGGGVATGIVIHMYCTIDNQLDMAEKQAIRNARASSFIRSLIIIATLVVCMLLYKWVNPFAVLIGLFSIKISVYLRPVLLNIDKNRKKRG